MVAPPDLVRAMTFALGEEEGPVRVALRRLRDHKKIEVFGRGRHAKDLPTEAAVRLLLGLSAAMPLEPDSPVRAVDRFESLPCTRVAIDSAEGAEKVTLPLDELETDHYLGSALALLLEKAGSGSLMSYTYNSKRTAFDVGYLRVSFFLPLPAARIVHALGGVIQKTWDYGDSYYLGPAYLSAVRSKGLGGRARTTELDETVLETLGRALVVSSPD